MPARIAKKPQRSRGQRAAAATLDRAAFVRPIAHRGWHDRAKGRIENTAPAFLAAIAKGYGIECDLQPASDGTPMVFHDATLDRLTEASGPIAGRTPSALARLRYKGQDTSILRFAELLELVQGRIPLLVEVKGEGAAPDRRFLDKIAAEARAYRGPIALMSFQRAIVTALAELAPGIPRGLVVDDPAPVAGWWAEAIAARERARGKADWGPLPDGVAFFAHDVDLLPAPAPWIARALMQLPLFTWTVRTPQQRATAERWADAPIFEGYAA